MDHDALEYCDMLIIYGECGQNARRAARNYNARFPERRPITYGVILRLLNRARETGHLIPNRRFNAVEERCVRTVQNEEAILQTINDAPEMSIREVSREIAISRSTVHRVLRDNRYHAYHFTRVQHLQPGDYDARLRFCTWLLDQENNRPGFASDILFTDESHFTREGVFNTRNTHLWADENPRAFHVRNFQQRFSINLWAGVLNNAIIGPFEMPARLTGQLYAQFLQNDLPGLLENVPLQQRRHMFFQQDGAPPHTSNEARLVLNASYEGRWIGRGGPINWPARSPDLTPLDFFLWSTVKHYAYRERINSREELEDKIVEAFASVTAEMVQNTQRNLLERARLCIECNGGHFEHLL